MCWWLVNFDVVTSRVGLLVTSKFSRLGNAVNPSTLLSWLLAKLITFTCGRAPIWTIAVSLFFDRSTSSTFGRHCSNSAGIQVKPSPDKLKYRKKNKLHLFQNLFFFFNWSTKLITINVLICFWSWHQHLGLILWLSRASYLNSSMLGWIYESR